MSDASARAQGHAGGPRAAKAAFARSYGPADDDTEAWAIRFIRGDHSRFWTSNQTKYLRAKMGGGRPYTTDPGKALREHSVPDADQLQYAAVAEFEREAHAHAAAEQTLHEIEKGIKKLKPHRDELDEAVLKDLEWMERRARGLRAHLGLRPAA